MASEELFENVNRQMDGQNVITIAQPEHSSGELKNKNILTNCLPAYASHKGMLQYRKSGTSVPFRNEAKSHRTVKLKVKKKKNLSGRYKLFMLTLY